MISLYGETFQFLSLFYVRATVRHYSEKNNNNFSDYLLAIAQWEEIGYHDDTTLRCYNLVFSSIVRDISQVVS